MARSFHTIVYPQSGSSFLNYPDSSEINIMQNKKLTLNTFKTGFEDIFKLTSQIFTKIQQHYTFFANVGFSQWEVEKR